MRMYNFSICFENENSTTSKISYGNIKIGAFTEKFEIDLSYWNKEKYQQHWIESIKRLSFYNEDTSCLITSMRDPNTANFIFWWLLYRKKEKILIQNQVFFLNDIKKPFHVNNPYEHISERETATEDGTLISEWEITLDDIKKFLINPSEVCNKNRFSKIDK